MNEDELDKLLDDVVVEDRERQEREEIKFEAIKRDRRLERAFARLNVSPDNFNQETGEYPEVDDFPLRTPPPASYWRWYAIRVIEVANVIVEDDWKPKLDQIEMSDMGGKIALGLLYHAIKGDVDSLADKIRIAFRCRIEGLEVKAWLAVRIVVMLTHEPQKREEIDHQIVAQMVVAADEKAESHVQSSRMSAEEVGERLLRRVDQGDEFTSARQLAEEIGCSSNTVNKAIRNDSRLTIWANKNKRKVQVYGATKRDYDSIADAREDDPIEIAEAEEELEKLLDTLIQESTSEERADFHEAKLAVRGNLKATRLLIEQLRDQKGDHVYDRR